MYHKMLLVPERVRRLPNRFSWVDQRLIRDGYFKRCSRQSMALYLLLVTVGNAEGMSYYSDGRLAEEMGCDRGDIVVLRNELIQAGLLAYSSPHYQVLEIKRPEAFKSFKSVKEKASYETLESPASDEEVSALLRGFLGGGSR